MKVLFVCTGNSCRSVMAKWYTEKRLSELWRKDIAVSSAGIAPFPGMRATEETKQVMKEEGIDISDHIARRITELEIEEADFIFVMESIHREYILKKHPYASNKIYFLKDFRKIGDISISEDPNIPDPIGKDIDFYRTVFSIIKDSIEKVLKEIA